MQAELQNVGGGKAGCWREIVHDFCDGKGGDFCRRIFTQALHAACHVPHGARAGKGEALLSAAIIAVGLIERVHCVTKRHAAALIEARHFTEKEHSVHTVLIAHVAAREIAVALFKAKEKALLMPF